jgi:peptidoglycan/xylan/chitin deacetylase (PgdA/CDA1 family)
MFHRIINTSQGSIEESNRILEVSVNKLLAMIEFFRALNYEFVSLDRFIQSACSPDIQKQKLIVVSFDDGYKDLLTLGLPIFSKNSVPFVLYLTSSFADQTFLPWKMLLNQYLKDVESVSFSQFAEPLPTVSTIQKSTAFKQIADLITKMDRKSQLDILGECFHKRSEDIVADSKRLMLTWDDVKELSMSSLSTIAAHTVNHPHLSETSEETIVAEVSNSIRAIETNISKKVHHFAYPYGGASEITEREINIVRKCGLRSAVTTTSKCVKKVDAKNLFSLPRILICDQTDLADLETWDLKLRLGWS